MKAALWFLIGVGVISVFVGLLGELWPISLLGLALIGVAIYLGVRPNGVFRKEKVFENWSALVAEACIDDGQGRVDNLYRDITHFLDTTEVPHLVVLRQDLLPTLTQGIFGDKRDFLVLVDDSNDRLEPYRIYINARPYGTNLACDWYLTYRPTLKMALLSFIPFVEYIPKLLSDLDLFNQQDLRAYATNAHRCTLRAVEELMMYLQQDPGKLEKKSNGFLAVS
jgi:hypothetical protein